MKASQRGGEKAQRDELTDFAHLWYVLGFHVGSLLEIGISPPENIGYPHSFPGEAGQ